MKIHFFTFLIVSPLSLYAATGKIAQTSCLKKGSLCEAVANGGGNKTAIVDCKGEGTICQAIINK